MKKSTAAIALACSIFGGSLLFSPKAGSAAATPPADGATKGHALFMAQGCYLCHGSVGQGAPSVGAALVPLRLDDAGFHQYVRAPKGSMPRYDEGVLPDTDLTAIAAYLRSLPAPKRADAIALLASYA